MTSFKKLLQVTFYARIKWLFLCNNIDLYFPEVSGTKKKISIGSKPSTMTVACVFNEDHINTNLLTIKKVPKLATDPTQNVPHARIKKTMNETAKTILRINMTKIAVKIEDEKTNADRETAIEIDLDITIMTIDETLSVMIEIEKIVATTEITPQIGQETTDTKTSQKNHVTVHQIQLTLAAMNFIDSN